MHDLKQKAKIIEMSKPISDNESERTEEAWELVSMIPIDLEIKLTSWELETITDIRNGKAATKFRLKEIREIVKRLQADAS